MRCNLYVYSIAAWMVSSFLLILNFYLPFARLWWHLAGIQCRELSTSRHYISKYCYSGCSMCSDHELGKGCVVSEGFYRGAPVTRVCHPLKSKCCGARKVQYILHHEDSPKVISLLLLLSGDVETNPGPGKSALTCIRTIWGGYCSNLPNSREEISQ